MPLYDYKCKNCGESFSLVMSMSEKEKTTKVKCPKCESENVTQIYSSFFAKTSKKS